MRRIRAGIASDNASGLSKMLGKALDFALDVVRRKIRGYDILQNEDCGIGVRMKDGHPGIKGAKLSRHGVLDRTPREAWELIAGPALVSLVDWAVGMDSGAHSKAVHDKIRIVRAAWGGYDRRRDDLGRVGRFPGALREDSLNPGVVWTDAVGGQLICRQVMRFEAAIICDRTILPLLARLICQRGI